MVMVLKCCPCRNATASGNCESARSWVQVLDRRDPPRDEPRSAGEETGIGRPRYRQETMT